MKLLKLSVDAENLKDIIERSFNLDLLDKRRHTRFIKARAVFSQILKRKGYGCYAISQMLGKNHATVLNYFKSFEWFIKIDEDFKESYEQINEQFESNSVIYTQLKEFELQKQLLLLQKENKSLYLENKKLKKQIKEAII